MRALIEILPAQTRSGSNTLLQQGINKVKTFYHTTVSRLHDRNPFFSKNYMKERVEKYSRKIAMLLLCCFSLFFLLFCYQKLFFILFLLFCLKIQEWVPFMKPWNSWKLNLFLLLVFYIKSVFKRHVRNNKYFMGLYNNRIVNFMNNIDLKLLPS